MSNDKMREAFEEAIMRNDKMREAFEEAWPWLSEFPQANMARAYSGEGYEENEVDAGWDGYRMALTQQPESEAVTSISGYECPAMIYLIDMGPDGISWCDDPAPGQDMDERDAVKYIRSDVICHQPSAQVPLTGIEAAAQVPLTGIEAAAQWVEERRDAYIEEHGSYDPSTGQTEFPGNGADYVCELDDIAEGIRSLSPRPAAPSIAGTPPKLPGWMQDYRLTSNCPPPSSHVPERMTMERAAEFVMDGSPEDGIFRFIRGWNMCREAILDSCIPALSRQTAQVPEGWRDLAKLALNFKTAADVMAFPKTAAVHIQRLAALILSAPSIAEKETTMSNDRMRDAINDLKHSVMVDGYTADQQAFLAAIANRPEMIVDGVFQSQQPESKNELCEALADQLYKAGYEDRRRERDYDPRRCRAWQQVVDVLDNTMQQQPGGGPLRWYAMTSAAGPGGYDLILKFETLADMQNARSVIVGLSAPSIAEKGKPE